MAKRQKELDEETADDAPETTPEKAPATTGGLSEIAQQLAASMPEPQPEAIAAVRQESAPASDPAIEPETAAPQKRGRGRPKGSGRKSTVSVPGSGAANNAANAPQSDVAQKQDAATRLAGASMAQLTILLGCLIGGEDFRPGPNEMAGGISDDVLLRDAYYEYCRAKGVVDIPPGIALCAAVMIYVAPRFNKPATKTRVGSLFAKIGGFFKRKKAGQNGPYADNRNDGKRQDDVGAVIGGGV